MLSVYDFTLLLFFLVPLQKKPVVLWKWRRIFIFSFPFFQAALNFSLPQQQVELPDNSTIESFVKDYVDRFVGGYNFICLYCFEF